MKNETDYPPPPVIRFYRQPGFGYTGQPYICNDPQGEILARHLDPDRSNWHEWDNYSFPHPRLHYNGDVKELRTLAEAHGWTVEVHDFDYVPPDPAPAGRVAADLTPKNL